MPIRRNAGLGQSDPHPVKILLVLIGGPVDVNGPGPVSRHHQDWTFSPLFSRYGSVLFPARGWTLCCTEAPINPFNLHKKAKENYIFSFDTLVSCSLEPKHNTEMARAKNRAELNN